MEPFSGDPYIASVARVPLCACLVNQGRSMDHLLENNLTAPRFHLPTASPF